MAQKSSCQGKVFTSNTFNEKSSERFGEEGQYSIKDLKIQILQQTDLSNQKDLLIRDIIQENKELELEV